MYNVCFGSVVQQRHGLGTKQLVHWG